MLVTLLLQLLAENVVTAQGRIALQIHDGGGIKVLWRNIKVTRI